MKKNLQNEVKNTEPSGGPKQHTGFLDIHLKINRDEIKQIFTYDVDSWFEILFAIKGRTLPWRPWLLVMFITTGMILVDDKYEYSILGKGVMNKSVNPVVHATFGVVLGFLIVYQSTQSGNRWWEARISWENIITHSREATRILCCHCNGREIIKLFAKYIIAFSVTSRHYLRKENFSKTKPCPELAMVLPQEEIDRLYMIAPRHRPLACLYACQRITEKSITLGLFTRLIARDINPRLVTLACQLGDCERILYTPMPWVYTLHLRLVLIAFLFLTPLGMFEEDPLPSQTQIFLFMGILSYAFLGLENMASKIQNPFGDDPSDLPLEIFTFVAYRDVKDIISMKYLAFDKAYTDRLYKLGQYEIEWKKHHFIQDEEDEEDDADE